MRFENPEFSNVSFTFFHNEVLTYYTGMVKDECLG